MLQAMHPKHSRVLIGYAFCFFFFWFFFLGHEARASLPQKHEFLFYDVKVFKLFKTLEVTLDIQPGEEKDTFLAHLTLKPVGLTQWVAPYKSCELYSKLRRVPDSNRLRPEQFEKKLVSDRVYRGIYRYDYQKGIVVGQGFFDDQPLKPETFPLPSEAGVYYDDFLSFIYNFRSGGYGDLKPGEKVVIRSVPAKRKGVFELEIANDELRKKLEPVKGARHLLVLSLDEKFFGFHVDRFFLWLSDENLPLYGLLKDVVGWGDIVGIFRGNEELS